MSQNFVSSHERVNYENSNERANFEAPEHEATETKTTTPCRIRTISDRDDFTGRNPLPDVFYRMFPASPPPVRFRTRLVITVGGGADGRGADRVAGAEIM